LGSTSPGRTRDHGRHGFVLEGIALGVALELDLPVLINPNMKFSRHTSRIKSSFGRTALARKRSEITFTCN
jgi:hypothetical protein